MMNVCVSKSKGVWEHAPPGIFWVQLGALRLLLRPKLMNLCHDMDLHLKRRF